MIHNSIGFVFFNSLIIITTIEVATIVQPMLTNNLFDVNKRFLWNDYQASEGERYRGVSIVVCQDRKPTKDSPHAILLTNMIGSCPKRFFPTNGWVEILSSIDILQSVGQREMGTGGRRRG